jgi:hypothetical protein
MAAAEAAAPARPGGPNSIMISALTLFGTRGGSTARLWGSKLLARCKELRIAIVAKLAIDHLTA